MRSLTHRISAAAACVVAVIMGKHIENPDYWTYSMPTTSDVVNAVNWTEKYRPQRLDDVGLEPDNKQVLQQYLNAGEIPNLCLIGPAGSGKTTIARIIINELDCVSLNLNASAERGIDVVREKIGTFAGALSHARWNIVFLDEADSLTSDAQTAMRNQMEAYADQTRFILTGNYAHRIIDPIQSRCQVMVLGRPPLKERVKILLTILKAEGVQVEPKNVIGYAERFPDMRKMLWAAQKAVLVSKNNTLPPVVNAGPITGEELLQFLTTKNWTKFRGLTTQGDFDVQQSLRELFWAVPDSHPKAGALRAKIGRGVHETGFTPDPIVLFLAVVAEAMELL